MLLNKTILSMLLVLEVFAPTLQAKHNRQDTPGRAARRHFDNALNARNLLDYETALAEIDKAIKRAGNYSEAYLLKATLLSETRQFEQSIEPYHKAIEINPIGRHEAHYYLAEAYHKTGQYLLAKKQYEQFLTSKVGGTTLEQQAKRGIDWCVFAIEAIENPVTFEPINLGANINSEFAEYSPALTADEQTLVFTRKVAMHDNIGKPTGRYREDFFVSTMVGQDWSESIPLGPPINTAGNEGAQALLPDGSFMFFTACNRPDGLGSCDIYYSRRVGNNWSEPRNLGAPINSSSWDSHPSVTADGKTLYFSSARNGSIGPKDIWMSTLGEKGQFWTEPVNLGPIINTQGNEMSPFIHHDNQTLYFASDGHPGMGALDLFVSRRDSLGNWSRPLNLGYPINTHYDEFALVVGASGIKAYFASDMPGGFGEQDIYSFQLPQETRPSPVTYMKGLVLDSETKEKLQATFLLVDVVSGQEIIRSTSDRQTGEFLIAVPARKDLALNVSKEGYLFFSEYFNYSDTLSRSKPYLQNIPLVPIKEGETIILRNVFFDTNSSLLKPESKTELEKLVQFMNQNNKINVEIGGHTDNVGGLDYNMRLSRERARAVVNYLVNAGIEPERVSFEGYAFTMPVATNETEDARARNRRTELKITSP